MTDIINWEAAIAPRSVAFTRRGMTVAGPPSLSGRTQVAAYDAGYWTARLAGVNAAGPEKVKAFRRMAARLEGGSRQIRVPAFDGAQKSAPAVPGPATVTFSDGSTFGAGERFACRVIQVQLAATAALRATSISVTVTSAGEIVGGEYFSLGERLHLISEIFDDGTWAIWPPLREAFSAGEELNFDNPTCLMRLANEGDDDLELEMGRYGFPDMNFIEVI